MAKTLGGKTKTAGRAPYPGSRFPSQAFGDNVRALRRRGDLSQDDLRDRMKALGFSYSVATLSELENGRRPTGVDELFALAFCLQVTVVKLLDPAGLEGGIDLGFDPPIDADDARQFIANDEDVWALGTARMTAGVVWDGNKPVPVRYIDGTVVGFGEGTDLRFGVRLKTEPAPEPEE